MLSGSSTNLAALISAAYPWRKVCLTLVAASVSCLLGGNANAQQMLRGQYGAQPSACSNNCPSGCRCDRCQSGCQDCYPGDGSGADGMGQDGANGANGADGADGADAPIDFNDASDTVAASPVSVAPNMIGDMSVGARIAFSSGYTIDSTYSSIPIAGGDRLFKIAENNSPIPMDRGFVNYHHFQNGVTDIRGQDRSIDRFTFGLEKTFLDGWASLGVRVPFASGLDSYQIATNPTVTATEFGNISLALKGLLYQNYYGALSVGMGVTLPTGQDATLDRTAINGHVYNVENESVHLQPFIGLLRTPTDRLFVMAFAQLDFDMNGNQVNVDTASAGTYHDQSLLLLDLSLGYWLYQDPCACRLTGVAAITELHYTSTISKADSARTAGGDGIVQNFGGLDILNLTGGVHFQLGDLSNLRVAASVPLKDDENRWYDAEVLVQFNRYF